MIEKIICVGLLGIFTGALICLWMAGALHDCWDQILWLCGR